METLGLPTCKGVGVSWQTLDQDVLGANVSKVKKYVPQRGAEQQDEVSQSKHRSGQVASRGRGNSLASTAVSTAGRHQAGQLQGSRADPVQNELWKCSAGPG